MYSFFHLFNKYFSELHARQFCRQQGVCGGYPHGAYILVGKYTYFDCDKCNEKKPGKGFREWLGILLTVLFQHVQIELIIFKVFLNVLHGGVPDFSLYSPRLGTWGSSLTSFLSHASNLSWSCTVYLYCLLYSIYFWPSSVSHLLQQSPCCLSDISTFSLDFWKSINYKTSSIMSYVLKMKICLN